MSTKKNSLKKSFESFFDFELNFVFSLLFISLSNSEVIISFFSSKIKILRISILISSVLKGLISKIKLQDLKESGKNKKDIQNPFNESGLHFNYFTLFIIFLISQIDHKASLISKLIYIANNLYELRNFQGFAIIMTSLTHNLIQKYVNTILEPADKETFNIKISLEQLFDKFNAYKNFKKTMNSSSFPIHPGSLYNRKALLYNISPRNPE